MKYADQGPYPGDHWFWRDSRRNHDHDRRGQAIVRWRVKPSAASGWREHGIFTVTRLLMSPPRGVTVDNVCGLSQCINPTHWRPRVRRPRWCVRLDGSSAWYLASVATGKPCARATLLCVRVDGVTHAATFAPGPRTGPLAALCGAPLEPTTVIIADDLPTCTGCL